MQRVLLSLPGLRLSCFSEQASVSTMLNRRKCTAFYHCRSRRSWRRVVVSME